MKTEPFIIERTYNAPVEKVWHAITDRDAMKKWYFDIAEFKPEVGFEFSFTASDKGKTFLHLCKVTEVEPGKKITYSWRYDGEPGNSFVTWELFDEGDKTRLTLTHAGLETFPPKPEYAKTNFEKGWTHIIGTSLKAFFEGK